MLDLIAQLEVVAADGAAASDRLARVLGLPLVLQSKTDHVDNLLWDHRAGESLVQVIAPMSAGANADRFIRRRGEGLYFCCFRISDYSHEAVLQDLLQKQVQLSGAYHQQSFPDYKVIWVHPKSNNGLLMELGDCLNYPGWTGGGTVYRSAGRRGEDWFEQPDESPYRGVRQLVLVVPHLQRALARWEYAFGLPTVWQGEDDRKRWAVMRLLANRPGQRHPRHLPWQALDTFIEFREPTAADSEEGRFLAEIGEGLFSAMLEAEDLASIRERVAGFQAVQQLSTEYADFDGFAVNPEAVFGCRFEIGRPTADNPWPPAGPDWWRSPAEPVAHQPANITGISPYLDQSGGA